MAARAKGDVEKTNPAGDTTASGDRIYQRLARHVFDDLIAGRYDRSAAACPPSASFAPSTAPAGPRCARR